MKKIIFLFVNLIMFCYLNSEAQYVTIEGKQFKLNGNNYYPMIMNYSVEPIKFLSSSTYYITAMHSYGAGNNFECTNDPTCNTQIQNDFNYISGIVLMECELPASTRSTSLVMVCIFISVGVIRMGKIRLH